MRGTLRGLQEGVGGGLDEGLGGGLDEGLGWGLVKLRFRVQVGSGPVYSSKLIL